jgi:large subunit ribosomal protein L25
MTEVLTLAAEVRERAGKGAARAARRAGRIPAVIYGAKKDPLMVTVGDKEIRREVGGTGFFTTIYEISVGKKKERVLPRDVHLDPVSDAPLHVDFLRVSATTEVTVAVPVTFLNEEECPGLVKGGVLNVVRFDIEVVCRADDIPSEIEIDLTGKEVGDSVHISEIELPEGVAPTITDRDFTIVTIAAPSALKAEEEEEELEGEEEELLEGEEEEEGEAEEEKE